MCKRLLLTSIAVAALLTLTACEPAALTSKRGSTTEGTRIPESSRTPESEVSTIAPVGETTNATSLEGREVNTTSSPGGLSPSSIISTASIATSTTDFSEFAGLWKRYTNEEYGISFEYPAVYDESPYKDRGCSVKVSAHEDEVEIHTGMRILLVILEAVSESLAEYVDKFVEEQGASPDFALTSRTDTIVGGADAVTLEYRFGGANRIGTVTFFKRGDRMYALHFTAGGFCESAIAEDTASGMTEFGTYFHILESLKFEH